MELSDAMRHTGTCRYFTSDPVPDDVVLAAVEAARFGPQGGNRQPVRFVVVRDASKRAALQRLYLPAWRDYMAAMPGVDERTAAQQRIIEAADHFAEHMHEAPAIVVVCAELAALHATDAELGRLSVVGGASIYPIVQNLCLALREHGVGSALTTLLCRFEPQVRELLDIPAGVITAAHVVVGYPERPWPTRLTRMAPEELVFFDSYGG